jgi:hypothetical protein
MNDRVAEFAETYSKMTDEEFSRVVSDEKSLIDEARVALQSEMQRRKLTSSIDDGKEPGGRLASLWQQQLAPVGVGGWLQNIPRPIRVYPPLNIPEEPRDNN